MERERRIESGVADPQARGLVGRVRIAEVFLPVVHAVEIAVHVVGGLVIVVLADQVVEVEPVMGCAPGRGGRGATAQGVRYGSVEEFQADLRRVVQSLVAKEEEQAHARGRCPVVEGAALFDDGHRRKVGPGLPCDHRCTGGEVVRIGELHLGPAVPDRNGSEGGEPGRPGQRVIGVDDVDRRLQNGRGASLVAEPDVVAQGGLPEEHRDLEIVELAVDMRGVGEGADHYEIHAVGVGGHGCLRIDGGDDVTQGFEASHDGIVVQVFDGGPGHVEDLPGGDGIIVRGRGRGRRGVVIARNELDRECPGGDLDDRRIRRDAGNHGNAVQQDAFDAWIVERHGCSR